MEIATEKGTCLGSGENGDVDILPDELWVDVYKHLPARDVLLGIGATCVRFRSIVADRTLWEHLYERDVLPGVLPHLISETTTQRRYRVLHEPFGIVVRVREAVYWRDVSAAPYAPYDTPFIVVARLNETWGRVRCKVETAIGSKGYRQMKLAQCCVVPTSPQESHAYEAWNDEESFARMVSRSASDAADLDTFKYCTNYLVAPSSAYDACLGSIPIGSIICTLGTTVSRLLMPVWWSK
jgi:hypothetical protein